jgi:hypothetical protein
MPPQTVWPLGHWQLPETHDRPPEHTELQEPQLALSVEVFTQSCPQAIVPGRHCVAHAPARQSWPAEQVWPHVPQLAGSASRSAHVEAQAVWVPGHTQWPAGQTKPGMQLVPQLPQLARSVWMSTQIPPQGNWLRGHLQLPPTQAVPPVQVTPHEPQLPGSV